MRKSEIRNPNTSSPHSALLGPLIYIFALPQIPCFIVFSNSLLVVESATTGIAGGMRKAPKRGCRFGPLRPRAGGKGFGNYSATRQTAFPLFSVRRRRRRTEKRAELEGRPLPPLVAKPGTTGTGPEGKLSWSLLRLVYNDENNAGNGGALSILTSRAGGLRIELSFQRSHFHASFISPLRFSASSVPLR
jgi:hypothetical protein